MSFVLPEIILTSVIQDGLQNCRDNSAIIQDVFGNLTRSFASAKYGTSEINKIQTLIQTKPIPVVHSMSMVTAEVPCVSIALINDQEDTGHASFSDYMTTIDSPLTDPSDLAALVVVSSFTPTSYNATTGALLIPDGVDLTQVYINLLFIDSTGVRYPVLGGIIADVGHKQILIASGQNPSLSAGATIQSSLNYVQNQVKGNVEKVQLMIGIHTKDPLMTKYLYTLVKYFILSRKVSLINRDFQLATYSGSDFTRDQQYGGDAVFTRFLTINGMVQNDWNAQGVVIYDDVNVILVTTKDEFTSEELGLANQTTKTE